MAAGTVRAIRWVALTLAYYVVLWPVGVVWRRMADPLNRRYRPKAESYFLLPSRRRHR